MQNQEFTISRGTRMEHAYNDRRVYYIVKPTGSIYRSDPKLQKTFKIY